MSVLVPTPTNVQSVLNGATAGAVDPCAALRTERDALAAQVTAANLALGTAQGQVAALRSERDNLALKVEAALEILAS